MEKFWVQKSSCTDVSSTLIILMIRWNSQPSLTSIFQNYNVSIFCVQVGAQMDVKLRSLICMGLNEQVLHLWWECLASADQVRVGHGVDFVSLIVNPTSRRGGLLKPPKQKWQFQHFFGANWAQKFDFSHKPTRMPIIAFRRLELVKKGVSITFLMLAVTNSGSWN